MATFGDRWSIEANAAADLRTQQYHIVRNAGAQLVALATSGQAAFTIGPMGVALNKANSGQSVTVAYAGPCKIVTGAAVTAGAMLTTNASGRAIAATTGSQQIVVGRALTTGAADGEVITAVLFPPQRLVGTN